MMQLFSPHASPACKMPKPRRVIHLEYSSAELPGGVRWYSKV